MALNFIFSHLNAIVLAIWLIFFAVVAVRFLRPAWLPRLSFGWLAVAAISLHLLFALFITWGQYHVWATGSDFTRVFLSSPLSPEAPLPGLFEWIRGYFEQPLGYFAYYVIGRFFLKVVALFMVSLLFYFLFKVWNKYRNIFAPHGPELLLALMLISGWPGILVLIPLGLVLSVLSFALPPIYTKVQPSYNKTSTKVEPLYEVSPKVQPSGTQPSGTKARVSIEWAFLIATPLTLLFANSILAYSGILALLAI